MEFDVLTEGDYRWIKAELSETDNNLLEEIKKKAIETSKQVNPKNLGREIRDEKELFLHNLAGIFAEEVIKGYLTQIKESNNVKVIKRDFEGYGTHVDVDVEVNGVLKTIEVRSSFQYKTSISRVLNGAFAIIGPYTHSSKKQEKIKDFYITVIHRCEPLLFAENLDKFNSVTNIIGGVSKENLIKLGKKDDGNFKQKGVEYLEVRPIVSAPDVVDLFKEILKEN